MGNRAETRIDVVVAPDVLPPVTELIATGAWVSWLRTGYIRKDTELKLTSVDDLVQAGDGVGLGVKGQRIEVRGEGIGLVRELTFDNPEPGRGKIFVSTFTLAGVTDGIYNLSYNAEDIIGNLGGVKISSYAVDNTPPATAALLGGTAGENGWHISPVTVTVASTDALSGVGTIGYRMEGPGYTNEETAYISSFTVAAEGIYTLRYHSADNVGNLETEKSTAFKIDRTTPQISYALNPAPNSYGWNNTAVQAVFNGRDALSGVAECSSATVSAEGRTQTVAGWCRDIAGNTGYSTAAVNIDRTPPVITISSPAARETFIATRNKIIIGFGVADNLDPAPVFEVFLVQLQDKGSPRGNRPLIIAVTNGQAIEPLDIDDGVWRLTVSATDFADNAAYLAGGDFDVIHDVLAPRTELTVSGTSYMVCGARDAGCGETGAAATTYIRNDTELKLTSVDDLVQAGDGLGLGVKKQAVKLKAEGLIVKKLTFENPTPGQGRIFVSTFTLADAADGIYALAYNAEDVLGNVETVRISSVAVDNTAPVTTRHFGGPYYVSGGANYITPATPATFAADDPVIATVASGVERMEVAIDGGAYIKYASALNFDEGRHTINYRAYDNVGNLEAAHTLEIQSDATAPASKWLVDSGEWIELGSRFYLNAAGSIALESSDPLINGVASGLEGIYYGVDVAPAAKYAAAFGLAEGVRTVNYSGKDNVGNTEVLKSTVIYADGTAPVSVLSLSGDQYKGDRQYISLRTDIIITAEDPVVNDVASGVKTTGYRVEGIGYSGEQNIHTLPFKLTAEGKHIVSFHSADRVDAGGCAHRAPRTANRVSATV